MGGRLAVIAEFKCPQCGERFKACAAASDGWRLTCPEGHRFTADEGRENQADSGKTADYNNRQFIGTQEESLAHGFNDFEVGEARRIFGEAGFKNEANMIQNDGSLRFGSRAQERAYKKAYDAVRRGNEQRVDEARHEQGMEPLER